MISRAEAQNVLQKPTRECLRNFWFGRKYGLERSGTKYIKKNQHGKFTQRAGSIEIMISRAESQNILQKPTRECLRNFWFDRNYGLKSRGPKYITKTNTGSLRNALVR